MLTDELLDLKLQTTSTKRVGAAHNNGARRQAVALRYARDWKATHAEALELDSPPVLDVYVAAASVDDIAGAA